MNHEGLSGKDGELVVLNVQTPVPPRVTTMVGADAVAAFHDEEAQKVMAVDRVNDEGGVTGRIS